MYKIYFIYFCKYWCDSTNNKFNGTTFFYKSLFHIIDTYTLSSPDILRCQLNIDKNCDISILLFLEYFLKGNLVYEV